MDDGATLEADAAPRPHTTVFVRNGEIAGFAVPEGVTPAMLATLLTLVALLPGAPQTAPTPLPKFGGTWVLVPGTGHPAGEIPTKTNTPIRREASGTFGRSFTMTLEPSKLTLVRTAARSKITTVYTLDGRQSLNEEGSTTTVSVATWNGPRLTLQTWIAPQKRPSGFPLTRVLWLEKGQLVIEERATGAVPVVSKYRRR